MIFRTHNENESPDDGPVIDAFTGDLVSPKIARPKKQVWAEMIKWAQDFRGAPFLDVSLPKQYKAFAIASRAGLRTQALRDRWEEMDKNPFWSERGFDWMDVVLSFNKKPARS